MIMGSVLVEMDGTDGRYLDTVHIDDPVDLYEMLDGYIGTDGPWPSSLELVNTDSDAEERIVVLWSVSDTGSTGWRMMYTDAEAASSYAP